MVYDWDVSILLWVLSVCPIIKVSQNQSSRSPSCLGLNDRHAMSVSKITTDMFFLSQSKYRPSILIDNLQLNMTCHQICNLDNLTGATNCTRNAYPSGRSLRVAPCLVRYVLLSVQFSTQCSVNHCLSLCPFPFGHCIGCPQIYRF